MELFREEYKLSLGPNWGKITYDRMQARNDEGLLKTISKSVKEAVQTALASHDRELGVFNGTSLLQSLSEDELCSLFSQSELQCGTLVLQNWKVLSMRVLRCASINFSECLVEMDLSNSSATSAHLEVLLPRTLQIKTLNLSNCRELDVKAFTVISKLTNCTLTELYVNRCPVVREDALLWIGGAVGFNQPKLKKLTLLDVSETRVLDGGIIAVSNGCRKLQYLNLKDCFDITDKAIQAVAKNCPHLKLLNMNNCGQLTNKSVIAIGQHCHELMSISMSRLLKIDNKGVIALASGCRYIQSINISGCFQITELSLCALVENCSGLLMLNVSGCPEISSHGIAALVRGLKYVEPATSFTGFKPIDKHIEKKLDDQMKMIRGQETFRLQSKKDSHRRRNQIDKIARAAQEDRAALIIQRQIHAYTCRMVYYRMWKNRIRSNHAVIIQRVLRGVIGRNYVNNLRKQIKSFQMFKPYAITIQRYFRGYLGRKSNPVVAKALCDLYRSRKEEAYTGILVRIQAFIRRYLAKAKQAAWKELCTRRAKDEMNAAITIQLAARGYISRQRMERMRHVVLRFHLLRRAASNQIKVWYKKQRERIILKAEGQKLFDMLRRLRSSAIMIQRVVRGYRGRQIYNKLLIDLAVKHRAAIMIQSAFRASKVLHWKDIKMNMVAAFVLDRHYVDRKNTIYRTRLRYQQFLYENRGDSDSDPDEDVNGILWVKAYDEARKKDYWYNNVNTDIVFEEPVINFAHENSLIGFRVKVYWVVQKCWYEGVITRFLPKTRRHRIQYDDGDREWINLEKEHERIQIQTPDGSWMLYQLYESPALQNEIRKLKDNKSKEEFKAQAFKDALQWKAVQSDQSHGSDILFISQITGEIRKGTINSLDWVVQDDTYGFPCFYNMSTQDIVHEDPRFEMDEDEDLAGQRKYVMQELRYALYFCSEFWEQFSHALSNGDARQQQILCLKVCKSLKPKHLSSFLLRAQALYQRTSVVDKSINTDIEKELEYAAFIYARMVDMNQRGEEIKNERKIQKKNLSSGASK